MGAMPEAVGVTGHHDGFGAHLMAHWAAALSALTGLQSDRGISNMSKVHIFKNHAPRWPHHSYYTPAVRADARRMYFSAEHPRPCPFDVAIHIRRGDVRCCNAKRWTDTSQYVSLVK